MLEVLSVSLLKECARALEACSNSPLASPYPPQTCQNPSVFTACHGCGRKSEVGASGVGNDSSRFTLFVDVRFSV